MIEIHSGEANILPASRQFKFMKVFNNQPSVKPGNISSIRRPPSVSTMEGSKQEFGLLIRPSMKSNNSGQIKNRASSSCTTASSHVKLEVITPSKKPQLAKMDLPSGDVSQVHLEESWDGSSNKVPAAQALKPTLIQPTSQSDLFGESIESSRRKPHYKKKSTSSHQFTRTEEKGYLKAAKYRFPHIVV